VQCTNFQNELSALQALSKDLGVVVDSMPKYHAELAGEGIEYSWGHTKGVYCQMQLSHRKGCSIFVKLVQKCCSPVDELMIACVRLMARSA